MPEALVSTRAAPGWFGKLPNLGDFASRRLSHRFVRAWDDWLQRGLLNARDALGEQWLAVYLVAPIRRFWLAPGLLGRTAWAGVLMPSVDAVGRHFPLTIAGPIAEASIGLAEVLAAREWFHAIDAVARQVLDMDFTVDDLERCLAGVAPPPLDAPGDAAAQGLAAELLRPFLPGAAPDPAASAGSTAVSSVRTRAAPLRCSVWWCDDADQASQFMCFAALPQAASFGALLGACAPAPSDPDATMTP